MVYKLLFIELNNLNILGGNKNGSMELWCV